MQFDEYIVFFLLLILTIFMIGITPYRRWWNWCPLIIPAAFLIDRILNN